MLLLHNAVLVLISLKVERHFDKYINTKIGINFILIIIYIAITPAKITTLCLDLVRTMIVIKILNVIDFQQVRRC